MRCCSNVIYYLQVNAPLRASAQPLQSGDIHRLKLRNICGDSFNPFGQVGWPRLRAKPVINLARSPIVRAHDLLCAIPSYLDLWMMESSTTIRMHSSSLTRAHPGTAALFLTSAFISAALCILPRALILPVTACCRPALQVMQVTSRAELHDQGSLSY